MIKGLICSLLTPAATMASRNKSGHGCDSIWRGTVPVCPSIPLGASPETSGGIARGGDLSGRAVIACPRAVIACPRMVIACPRAVIACPWTVIACPRAAIALSRSPAPASGPVMFFAWRGCLKPSSPDSLEEEHGAAMAWAGWAIGHGMG